MRYSWSAWCDGKKKRQAINIQRSTEARSRNNYCRGRAIHIKYFECVSILSRPACEALAPYYIVLCGPSGSIVFSILYKKFSIEFTYSILPSLLVNATVLDEQAIGHYAHKFDRSYKGISFILITLFLFQLDTLLFFSFYIHNFTVFSTCFGPAGPSSGESNYTCSLWHRSLVRCYLVRGRWR